MKGTCLVLYAMLYLCFYCCFFIFLFFFKFLYVILIFVFSFPTNNDVAICFIFVLLSLFVVLFESRTS